MIEAWELAGTCAGAAEWTAGMIFASAPEPVDGVAHVWLENGSGVLAELLPSEARDLAADLLAAALFAENGWNCLEQLAVPRSLQPHRQERTSAAAREGSPLLATAGEV